MAMLMLLLLLLMLMSTAIAQWHVRIDGSGGNEAVYGITVDTTNSIIAVGHYCSSSTGIYNGNDATAVTTISKTGQCGIFVLKLSSSGSYQWHNRLISSNNVNRACVAVDLNGNVAVAGDYMTDLSIHIGQSSTPVVSFCALYSKAAFVARFLGSNGQYSWHARMEGWTDMNAHAVGMDSTGAVIVQGDHRSGVPAEFYLGSSHRARCNCGVLYAFLAGCPVEYQRLAVQ
jgi:hypothetical protein